MSKKYIPAYRNKATFSRFSSYARASVRDFENTLATKPFIKENMEFFARAIYLPSFGEKKEKGPVFCEICLAAGTFGIESEKPGDTEQRCDVITQKDDAARWRMWSVDNFREGLLEQALSTFYVSAKGVKNFEARAVLRERESQIRAIENYIKANYDFSLKRAPLPVYYESCDRLEKIGL